MPNRHRGEGSVYRQKDSRNWRIQFVCANGRTVNQTTGTDDYRRARDILRDRMAEARLGLFDPETSKVLVRAICESKLVRDRANGRKAVADEESRWKLHLEPAFGDIKAMALSTRDFDRYVAVRQSEGAGNGSINRELAFMRAALARAVKDRSLMFAPHVEMLEEPPARDKLLTGEQAERMARACDKEGLWLRTMYEVARAYGWRLGEVIAMKVGQLDFVAGVIRLKIGSTKNKEGRDVPMTPLVRGLLLACCTGKGSEDFVLTRERNRPVRNHYKAWRKAVKAAGLPEDLSDLRFHDLRRTAITNYVEGGTPEKVVMQISGHRTRSTFERYHIVSPVAVRAAVDRLAAGPFASVPCFDFRVSIEGAKNAARPADADSGPGPARHPQGTHSVLPAA